MGMVAVLIGGDVEIKKNKNMRLGWRPSADLTIFAGENGSGKSTSLRDVAKSAISSGMDVLAISGTIYDRFRGLGLAESHIYPGKRGNGAGRIFKNAIRDALMSGDGRAKYVSRILRHCGYYPDVGLEVVRNKKWVGIDVEMLAGLGLDEADSEDLITVIYKIQSRWDKNKILWIDFDSVGGLYFDREMVLGVFRWEKFLRKIGVISDYRVYIRKGDFAIPLGSASSGELSLMSCLVYISSKVSDYDLILIDEPENSLHPRWQRDFIDLLMAAVQYSGVRVVVATHSPLLVLSVAEREMSIDVFVFSEIFDGVDVSGAAGLEEVMAKVFHTITPRNSYLSRSLAEMVDDVANGKLAAGDALRRISEIRASGVDEKQGRMLRVVVDMVGRVS